MNQTEILVEDTLKSAFYSLDSVIVNGEKSDPRLVKAMQLIQDMIIAEQEGKLQ